MSDEVVVRVADAEVIRGQDGFSPIFSSEAIPGGHLVRVEDVNGPHEFNVLDGERGKTGATGAKGDKGDPGNYTKPDSGIPKTDLSSAVQASLDKADTAIQLGLTGASVGDLVRVAAIDATGKPTSWNHVPLCEIVTNENLMDNWDFVGGGSQQGGGQVPINQRGQASYPNAGKCIDRWENSGAFYISQNYINMAANTSITQKLESGLKSSLNGKNITLSLVCLNNTNLVTGTVVYQSAPESAITVASDSNFTLSITHTGDIELKSTNTYASCQAIKLELGTKQTLAHQENSKWVLNEIPDYISEMLKCQRHFQTFRTEAMRPTYGADCRPVMASDEPTKSTTTISGVTYYTLEA